MTDLHTVAQQGSVRLSREADPAEIDLDRLLLDTGDGLNLTEICGNRNSYKQSDGDGTLVVRRIVRGNGVNTVFADSGSLAGTLNILGMVVLTDTADVRVAVTGSIIDGFVGLTKHAVYYLGASGQISLTPGLIPVQVGIAVSTTELLLEICCCTCSCELPLEKCFSGSLFECDEGAEFTMYGTGTGEKIPALEFKTAVDNYWYCGFPTPPGMDTTQAAILEIRMAAPAAHPVVNTSWQVTYRSVLATQNLFTGGLATSLGVQVQAPAAQHTMLTLSYPIPANTLVAGAINRQVLKRLGTVDTYLGSMNVVAVTLKYACN